MLQKSGLLKSLMGQQPRRPCPEHLIFCPRESALRPLLLRVTDPTVASERALIGIVCHSVSCLALGIWGNGRQNQGG